MEPEQNSSSGNNPGWALFSQILQCEGERLRWQIEGLQASYLVFSQNFVALRGIVEFVENSDNREKFVAVHQRHVLKALQQDMMRHLHNVLAGAGTLIDHTRVLVERLYPADHCFRSEYANKVKEVFGASGPAGLIKGMRNWVLHRDIFPLKVMIVLFTNRSQAVVLDIGQLNSFDGWDSRARTLLTAHRSDIKVLPLMQEYHDRIEEFYTWLGQRMNEIHAEAFEELRCLQNKYQAYLPPGLKGFA